MKTLKNILDQMDRLHRDFGLFKKGERLVVGVSGGPDSTALLYLLSKLQRKFQFRIYAAHLHHGLSRREGARFERLAGQAAARLGCPFFVRKVSVRKSARRLRRSLEEAGRIERYRFFEDVCRKTGSRKIATAHTLDDQAETVLMRLIRGSGIRGLGGIPPKRNQGSFEVVRPLLLTRKKDLADLLKQSGLRACKDPSNRCLDFTRNRIRRRLLPAIAKDYNPQIMEALSSLQGISAEAQDCLERLAEKVYRRAAVQGKRAGGLALRLAVLRRTHSAILRLVLAKALQIRRGDLKRFGSVHFEAIDRLLRSSENGLETHLPGPLTVRKSRRTLDFI